MYKIVANRSRPTGVSTRTAAPAASALSEAVTRIQAIFRGRQRRLAEVSGWFKTEINIDISSSNKASWIEVWDNWSFKDVAYLLWKGLLNTPLNKNLAPSIAQEYLFEIAKGNLKPSQVKGVVDVLIANGADVNARDDKGLTALYHAVIGRHTKVLRVLVDAGADVNAQDKMGREGLSLAAARGFKEVIELLIRKKVDMYAQDKYGNTALMCAAVNGQIDIVKVLIENGADVNAKGGYGMTPLDLAVEKGNADVVNKICEYGADVNAQDETGRAVLNRAIFNGHVKVAKMLIANGADVNIQQSLAQAALDIANQKRRADIANQQRLTDIVSQQRRADIVHLIVTINLLEEGDRNFDTLEALPVLTHGRGIRYPDGVTVASVKGYYKDNKASIDLLMKNRRESLLIRQILTGAIPEEDLDKVIRTYKGDKALVGKILIRMAPKKRAQLPSSGGEPVMDNSNKSALALSALSVTAATGHISSGRAEELRKSVLNKKVNRYIDPQNPLIYQPNMNELMRVLREDVD
ncbi:MAG: hypothetical protein CL521_05075 [Actinobacteria bacterium]|nr:hypothetical protein [Actinomycetota bacterium]